MRNRKSIILTPRGEMVCALAFMLLVFLAAGFCGYIETMP